METNNILIARKLLVSKGWKMVGSYFSGEIWSKGKQTLRLTKSEIATTALTLPLSEFVASNGQGVLNA